MDEISCIGCGKCVRACPMTFEIEDSKYGRARVISQTSDSVEDVQVGDWAGLGRGIWHGRSLSLPLLVMVLSAGASSRRVGASRSLVNTSAVGNSTVW